MQYRDLLNILSSTFQKSFFRKKQGQTVHKTEQKWTQSKSRDKYCVLQSFIELLIRFIDKCKLQIFTLTKNNLLFRFLSLFYGQLVLVWFINYINQYNIFDCYFLLEIVSQLLRQYHFHRKYDIFFSLKYENMIFLVRAC